MPSNPPVMHSFAIEVTETGYGSKVSVDGRELTAVTDFTLRAGANGYSNLIIGMTAVGLIEGCAAIKFQLREEITEKQERLLASIYDEVHATLSEELEEIPSCGKANIVLRLLTEVAGVFKNE